MHRDSTTAPTPHAPRPPHAAPVDGRMLVASGSTNNTVRVQVRVQVPAAQDAPAAGSEPAIRVELRKPAGSAVQFEPVGM